MDLRPLYLSCIVAAASVALSPATRGETDRAVVLYRQAVEQIPEVKSAAREALYPLDSEDRLACPVSPEVQELLGQLEPSLRLLREAGDTPGSPWKADEPGIPLGSNFHLVLFLPFTQALLDLQQSHEENAAANLRSGLLLVRRIRWEMTPLIAAVLCDSAESFNYRIIAQLLHRLSPEAMKQLDHTLVRLPASPTLAEATKQCLNDPILPRLLERLRTNRLTAEDEILLRQTGIPKDADTCAAIISDYHADLRTLALVLNQPSPKDYHGTLRFLDEVKKQRGEGHLSYSFLLDYRNAVQIRLRRDISLAQLRTAIAIRLRGPDAVNEIPDPYTGKPFKYEPQDEGFTLTSGFSPEDQPLSMTFTF